LSSFLGFSAFLASFDFDRSVCVQRIGSILFSFFGGYFFSSFFSSFFGSLDVADLQSDFDYFVSSTFCLGLMSFVFGLVAFGFGCSLVSFFFSSFGGSGFAISFLLSFHSIFFSSFGFDFEGLGTLLLPSYFFSSFFLGTGFSTILTSGFSFL